MPHEFELAHGAVDPGHAPSGLELEIFPHSSEMTPLVVNLVQIQLRRRRPPALVRDPAPQPPARGAPELAQSDNLLLAGAQPTFPGVPPRRPLDVRRRRLRRDRGRGGRGPRRRPPAAPRRASRRTPSRTARSASRAATACGGGSASSVRTRPSPSGPSPCGGGAASACAAASTWAAVVFGHFRAVFRAGSWSGRGSAYVDVLDALYGSVATRGLPSSVRRCAGSGLPALSRRIGPWTRPARRLVSGSASRRPPRDVRKLHGSAAPLTAARGCPPDWQVRLVERRGGATRAADGCPTGPHP